MGILRVAPRKSRGLASFYIWLAAILLGALSGLAAVAFLRAVHSIQYAAYGVGDYTVHQFAAKPLWHLVAVPVCAGLAVGLLIQFGTKEGRAHGIADVIRARDLTRSRVGLKAGVISAIVAAISLGGGASTGREGPVVHLAATLASALSRLLRAGESTSRTLLGCAVAAAVSALFNAPIAGTVFALEVVLGSYSLRVFAPIVAASVAGTVVSRTIVGDFPAFLLPPHEMESLWQLPAFILLGLLAAVTVFVLTRAIFAAEAAGNAIQNRFRLPLFIRPALAGILLGGMGYMVPQVIGVGYATTTNALYGSYFLGAAILVFLVKIVAVAISMGGRFGGGIFSPSIMLGALLGAAFGNVIAMVLSDPGTPVGIYALAGMGAVAAAVLGAPISTTLIVFEITGDYRTALAVMVAVSVAVLVSQRFLRRSFFFEQLERAGSPLSGGRHRHLLQTRMARDILRPFDARDAASESECAPLLAKGILVNEQAVLAEVLQVLDANSLEFVPVAGADGKLVGAVFHTDALRTYTRILARSYSDEHD